MTLASAFSTAWKDLKSVAAKVAGILSKDGPAIQAVVADASAVAIAIAPAAAPIVTAFDSLEELIVGKVAAFAQDAANATTIEALFGEEWPAIQSLIATLKNHPTVASVTTTLAK